MRIAIRIAPVVFVAAVIQVTVLGGERILGAEPDVLLVTIVAIALLRGALAGAVAGFAAGLLVDTMLLATLGVSSVVLTLVGYWIGRYGETTARGRPYAPAVSAVAATVVVAIGGGALWYLLGETVAARELLRTLVPSAIVAALLVLPVLALCRSLVGTTFQPPRVREVELV